MYSDDDDTYASDRFVIDSEPLSYLTTFPGFNEILKSPLNLDKCIEIVHKQSTNIDAFVVAEDLERYVFREEVFLSKSRVSVFSSPDNGDTSSRSPIAVLRNIYNLCRKLSTDLKVSFASVIRLINPMSDVINDKSSCYSDMLLLYVAYLKGLGQVEKVINK